MNSLITPTGSFEWLLNRSWQAAVLVLCVLSIQWLGRRSLTNRWRFALWWIVLARLLLPFGPASPLSLFNCFRPIQNAPIVSQELSAVAPAVTGVPDATPENPAQLTQSLPTPPENERITRTTALSVTAQSSAPLSAAVDKSPGHQFEPRMPVTILAMTIGCWLVGALFLSGVVVMQIFGLTRQLAKNATRADDRAYGLLRECCDELRIRRKIELFETDAVKSPALFGLFRLRLLLPRGLAAGFDRSELRYIFLHELAHVRRGDLWINCLVTVLQIVHWFNPLLWLGFARLRADRELACDELALQHTGETAAEAYGLTIVKLLKEIQRPSVMPGLVGILEDRTQMQRRISRIAGFKKATRWSALAILLLPALGLVALTDAQQEGTAHPNLTGTLQTKGGQPIAGTVFIYTAGPKVGTSTFCPSCYLDCQKSAKADAEGNYEIKSLDPQLIFRILAVAPGYKPKFVSKVDPAKGPVAIQLTPIELSAAPPGNCLHGRIVDTNGAPIVGAVVEAHGIRSFNGGGMWGQLNGVDPEAVTDDKGEFLITSIKPFDMMDVRVSARGYANANFTKLASGNEVHPLALTTGAAIGGRILLDGKPLADVEVSIVSADRTMDSSFANLTIGTGTDGRFLFLNLPPDVNYNVCGTMKSLAPFGATSVRIIHAGNDGSLSDVGDLIVAPGRRLAGRVVLADGKPVPSKTRLLIDREAAWDSLQVNLPPDGHFEIANVPMETYDLSVRVSGYYASPKNASYDALNPGRLIGRIDGDTTNLTILLERGKAPAPQEYEANQSDWPQNRPLQGVGANEQVDHSQDWVVSGRVTDAQTGQPLTQFSVTPGDENLTRQQIHWDERNAGSGTNGIYTIYMDKRWEQPIIKIEAGGYLPQSASVTPLEQTNADFAMQQGNGPSGIVRLPDGSPAAGADVLLFCPDASNPSLNYDGHLEAGWPQQDGILIKTDSGGHFSFEPRLGMQSVAAASPDGFGRVSISSLATNQVITLQGYGSIKGTLTRPNGPGTNEDLDLAFIAPDSSGHLQIENSAHTDSSGHFEFNHVPTGSLQLSYRVPMSQNGWQNMDLQKITLKPGQSLQLDINAPARETPERFGFGTPTPPPAQIPGAQINGTIVLPDGTPVVGAQVGLDIKGQFMQLGRGSIISYEGWKDGWVVRADQNGKFSLPMYQDAETVIAVSDHGFARVTIDALKKSPRIVLQPWAKMEGTLLVNRHAAVNQVLALTDFMQTRTDETISPLNFDTDAYRAKTDAEGHFVLTYIPPGTHELTRQVPEDRGWISETLGAFEFKASETKQVTFGGDVRTVVGRVNVDTNAPKDWQQGRLFLRTASSFEDKFRKAHSQEERNKLMESQAYRREIMNMHTYPGTLSPDGSFKAEDVVPGKYQLSIQFFKPGPMPVMPKTITYLFSALPLTVPKAIGTNDVPVDAGTVVLKTFTMPTFAPNQTNTATASR